MQSALLQEEKLFGLNSNNFSLIFFPPTHLRSVFCVGVFQDLTIKQAFLPSATSLSPLSVQ